MAKQNLSEQFKRMQKLAGLITENESTFPSENDIKAASEKGGMVTVDKNGTKYDVNYTVSSWSDREKTFGVYPSGGSEDEEQVAEFYLYSDLVDWFNDVYKKWWVKANDELGLDFDGDIADYEYNADESWQREFAVRVMEIDADSYEDYRDQVKKIYDEVNPF